jgi:recombination-associated protein rdgC
MKAFSQLSLFHIDPSLVPGINIWETSLQKHAIPLLLDLSIAEQGFAPPYEFSDQMVITAQNSWKIQLRKEKKLLPASVLRQESKRRIKEIEEKEYRQLSAKDKKALKQRVLDELLPRAFSQISTIEGIYIRDKGFLLVNQAQANKREELLSHLRQALGSFEAALILCKKTATDLMSQWLLDNNSLPDDLAIGNYCELKNIANIKSVSRFVNQDIQSKEVIGILEKDHFVSQLALIWQDKLRFILCEDFSLKNIQYLEKQQLMEIEPNDILTLQWLFSQDLTLLYEVLIKAAGGTKKR